MKILLAIDGSEGALSGVRHILWIAHQGLRASFVLANVQEPASLYEVFVAHDVAVIEQVSEAAAVHSLAAAQALLNAASLPFETEIGHGDPGRVLIEIAERCGCDVIVIGARGMDSSGGGALGPVASSVLQHANMPVWVVKGAEV